MKAEILGQILHDRRAKRRVVLATTLPTGEARLIHPDDPAIDVEAPEIQRAARTAIDTDQCIRVEGEGGTAIFFQPFNPPLRLVLVGAVHIAQPLSQMAALAGFEVVLVDPRTAFATEARFPGVARQAGWPDRALAEIGLDRRTAVVTLTHDPKLDDPAIEAALRSPVFYVGCLGSGKTHAARIARLRERGFTEAEVGRIFGPVGLRIGGRSPAEIAVSILAQIVEQLRSPRRPPSEPRPTGGSRGEAPAPTVAALVLAAGESRRMGEVNKLLVEVDGAPMIARVVDAILATRARPVVVVTGHDDAGVRAALAGRDLVFVHNARHAEGMSTSVRAGIERLGEDIDGALVCLGDMPRVRPAHVEALLGAFDPDGGRAICVPTWERRRGNPVLFAARYFPEMRLLSGDVGARSLLEKHAGAVCHVPMDDRGVTIDVDTPDALAALSGTLEPGP